MTRFLLLAYPRAWRERYGDELSQLVDEMGLSPRVALDLVAAGMGERLQSLKSALSGGTQVVIGPAWRHPGGLALTGFIVLAPVFAFVVGSMLAYQLGVESLVGPLESVNSWLATARVVDLFLVVSPAVALLLALAPLVRLEIRPGSSGKEAVIGLRLRLANLVVGGLALVIGGLLIWHIVVESVIELGV